MCLLVTLSCTFFILQNPLKTKKNTNKIFLNLFCRILEVELAQQILKSELLVSEDEDFINNFILSEDVLEKYQVRQ